MTEDRPRYAAYMLRLWQVGSDDGPTWCASLESPHTGELHVFAHLPELFAFLEKSTEALSDAPTSPRSQLS
jgi:hypothetical protein